MGSMVGTAETVGAAVVGSAEGDAVVDRRRLWPLSLLPLSLVLVSAWVASVAAETSAHAASTTRHAVVTARTTLQPLPRPPAAPHPCCCAMPAPAGVGAGLEGCVCVGGGGLLGTP